MRVVALVGLVLTVRRRDGDTALLFLRRLVDLIDTFFLGKALHGEHMKDSGSRGCLSMIDVADSADIDVRLRSLKLLCHTVDSILDRL